MSVEEVSAGWQVEPVDAALRLLLKEEGNVGMVGHGMSPSNVEMVLSHPLVMIGSDGSSVAPTGNLVVFDPEKVKDEATFADPHQFASGIAYVVVNGELVVDEGKHTGARPGKILRKA